MTNDTEYIHNKILPMLLCIMEDSPYKFRYLEKLEDALFKNPIIAFRFGSYDFHFMRRGRNNVWRHKCGASPNISYWSEDIYNPWVGESPDIY